MDEILSWLMGLNEPEVGFASTEAIVQSEQLDKVNGRCGERFFTLVTLFAILHFPHRTGKTPIGWATNQLPRCDLLWLNSNIL